jgi:hypothetical protein
MYSYASRNGAYPDSQLHEHLLGVLAACGIETWERVRGRTIMALSGPGKVLALKPLPTERGEEFWFRSEDRDKVES